MSIAFDLDLEAAIVALTNVSDPVAQRSPTDGLLDLRSHATRVIDDLCGANASAGRATHEILESIDEGLGSHDWVPRLRSRVKSVRHGPCNIPGLSAAGLEFTNAVRRALLARPSLLRAELPARRARPSGVFLSLIVIDVLMEYGGSGWRAWDPPTPIQRTNLLKILRTHSLFADVGDLAGRAFNANRFQWWSESGSRYSREIMLLAALLCP